VAALQVATEYASSLMRAQIDSGLNRCKTRGYDFAVINETNLS